MISDFTYTLRSRAPLRLGLAGGGTDLSPYCDLYGGSVLNVTINKYAYASLSLRDDDKLNFVANDLGTKEKLITTDKITLNNGLLLHRAVYNFFIEKYNNGIPVPLNLTTWIECPLGSGLGASSALVVALVAVFANLFELSLSQFETAHIAYIIEREKLALAGGRQDQYAAAFGGLNYMEFCSKNKVIVNPIQCDDEIKNELQASIILCFTGTSHNSSIIIEKQIKSINDINSNSIDFMHKLKRDALEMKLALMENNFIAVLQLLKKSWETKKSITNEISNNFIDKLYEDAIRMGALAGKISGAGGGGFMMLFVDPIKKNYLSSKLVSLGYDVSTCSFTYSGVESWTIKNYLDNISYL